METIVVVGGGVLGAMHAVSARQRGHEVVQLEREAGARGRASATSG
jgi:glycerol-3-phosphate dehydrogenase